MNRRKPLNKLLAVAVMSMLLAVGALSPTMLGRQSAAAQEPNPNCNSANNPGPGSVDNWLNTKYVNGENVDCIDVAFVAQSDCYLEHSIVNRTNFIYVLSWVKVDGPNDYPVWNDETGRTYSGIVQLADAGPGTSAFIYVDFRGPERGFVYGPDGTTPNDSANWFVGQDDKLFATWYQGPEHPGGKIYEVSTDCGDPEPELAYGCSQGFFKNNGYGKNTTLGDLQALGLTIGGYSPSATLHEVISNPGSGKIQKKGQTYDGLIRQQVTAYLNVLFALNYPLGMGDIFSVDQGTLEYYNHGGGVVDCRLK